MPGRGFGRVGASRRFRIVQRSPLTAQHCLHLVRMEDQEWVIATHPQGVTILRRRRLEADGREQTA
ncbi:MAG: flagellar biosynthetic protein FliO [Acidobacteria bacterium]|nr:flagellar biosynthetic protein FliO [Acidobacteriota bacterium]